MFELSCKHRGPTAREVEREVGEAQIRIREQVRPGFRALCERYEFPWQEVWAAVSYDHKNAEHILDACRSGILTPSEVVSMLRACEPEPEISTAEMLKSLANELRAAATPVVHVTSTRAQRRASQYKPKRRKAHNYR